MYLSWLSLKSFISIAEVSLIKFNISDWAAFSGNITWSIPKVSGFTIAFLCTYSVLLSLAITILAPNFFAILDATRFISSVVVSDKN